MRIQWLQVMWRSGIMKGTFQVLETLDKATSILNSELLWFIWGTLHLAAVCGFFSVLLKIDIFFFFFTIWCAVRNVLSLSIPHLYYLAKALIGKLCILISVPKSTAVAHFVGADHHVTGSRANSMVPPPYLKVANSIANYTIDTRDTCISTPRMSVWFLCVNFRQKDHDDI